MKKLLFFWCELLRKSRVVTLTPDLAVFVITVPFVLSQCKGKLNTDLLNNVKILALDYAILEYPDGNAAATAVSSVQSRSRTVFDHISDTRSCKFRADFTSDRLNENPPLEPPRSSVNGTPGQTGFNININSPTKLVNTEITNPPDCAVVERVSMIIGGISEALGVGGRTSRSGGRVEFRDGRKFEISEFFEADLDAFNDITRKATGRFRFVNRLQGSNTLLFVDGTFIL